MADDEDETTWVLNLEAALIENCNAGKIHNICKGKPFPEHLRPEAWQACLGVQNKEDQLSNFNEIYDLPEQEILRRDCQNIVEKLGNDDYDKVSVISDIESILTYYCKKNGVKYQKENGWIELLLPILSLKRPKSETYNIFDAIVNSYIPKNSTNDVYNLFRLLILYHDPEICTFLDTKKATPDLYADQWFKSLFSGTCYLKVVQSIWDIYFQQNNPFFIFFLSLVIVLNLREHVITFKNESREKIIESISSMPVALEYNDVRDFCSLAHYYALKTPRSFKKELYELFFNQNDACSSYSLKQPLSQTLCLPVTTNELVENVSETEYLDEAVDATERVRFFLVDCRPADQYNAGHLPTAFHLDCTLMIQEPSAFNVAVQGLLSAQKQSIAANSTAGGEHLCFLGSGRDEEDQYTHMVIASFLQKNTQYVSMLTGGYEAIHSYFGNDVADCLEDHDSRKCLICNSNNVAVASKKADGVARGNSEGGHDLLGKISEVIKNKSADFKEKFIDYIVNPSNSVESVRHISPRDKIGKIYRNVAPVFSIDDENLPDSLYYGEDEDEEISEEIVSLSEYLKSDKTIAHFKCWQLKESVYVYSYLLVTSSHIIVLRELSKRKGCALLVVKRPLNSIIGISSKKKCPNLVTFKYGSPDGDLSQISDRDRFLIPKATDAAKLISQQIQNTRTTGKSSL